MLQYNIKERSIDIMYGYPGYGYGYGYGGYDGYGSCGGLWIIIIVLIIFFILFFNNGNNCCNNHPHQCNCNR